MDIIKLFFISLVFIFSSSTIYAGDIDISKIRTLYIEAAEREKACREMGELLSAADEKTPLLLGYKASATMMMANYVFSPFSKLSYFKKGKKLLEHAIGIDKTNVELRLLRYMTQVNAPSFLGYRSKIESDKRFILDNISKTKDINSKDFVIMVLSKTKQLSMEEKSKLK